MAIVPTEPPEVRADAVPASGVRTYVWLWISQWLACAAVSFTVFVVGVNIFVDFYESLWLITLGYAILVPPLLYRIHRWEVTPEAVYTLSGWLVREWRIAPISRVQTVDTEHGPLQQMLKLATVTVTTASARGPVKISGLEAHAAAELARTLTETTQATPGDAT